MQKLDNINVMTAQELLDCAEEAIVHARNLAVTGSDLDNPSAVRESIAFSQLAQSIIALANTRN